MNELPLPGLHHNILFDDYAKWPAANFSLLKHFDDTASKARYAIDHPKETTPAMAMGSALHIATLEPARFDSMFYVVPLCDRRTAAGKAEWTQHELKAKGKMMIRGGDAGADQLELVRGMAKAIHASKTAQMFLDCPGQNEVSLLWKDTKTELMCKGRTDRLIPKFPKLDDRPVIVEIKSTRDASTWLFGKDCHSMGYAAQAVHYKRGYKAITEMDAAHVIIAVENEPPHDLMVHILDDEALQIGYARLHDWILKYAECLKTNQWPGYPDRVNVLSLPKWADKEI